jgi:N-acetylglucosamine kinase-like BadF-type ATPase
VRDVVVGLDVGASKAAILVETPQGQRLLQATVASPDWDAEPVEDGARWIAALLGRTLPTEYNVVGLGVGAQGLDTGEIAHDFTAALGGLGFRARAVNDAALLVPGAGLEHGIGVISGTGAIGVGEDASGRPLVTGGWGWVIGDEAGAAGLVREATKAALLAHDDGLDDDGLLGSLLAGFDVPNAERLARAVNDDPTPENWGPHAPAVFAAADAGSFIAVRVIEGAAAHLVRLVTQLLRHGAVGGDVVAAGSVIVNQARLFDAFRAAVRDEHPELRVHLLTDPPVVGALALARAASRTD